MYLALMTSPDGQHITLPMEGVIPTLEQLQDVVGGNIEPMFTILSPFDAKRELTGYVNEEGLLIGLPISMAVQDFNYGLRHFAGNMVIAAVSRNSKTLGITLEEFNWLSARFNRLSGILNLL